MPPDLGSEEASLVAAARAGDEQAFGALVEPLRGALQAHCYRMLGSLFDAEDAVQEGLLRAWQGLGGFDGRSSLATWLYRIATTTCLNQLRQRSRRVLPVDTGFRSADPADAAGPPLVESVWVEPYPDSLLEPELGPEARYELRESVELAFVAALQHLPGNARAALLLTDVLGFSAREAASMLDTTPASLTSALQRARGIVRQRVPPESEQPAARGLGDTGLAEVVERYLQAMERADVDAVVGLLREDACWSMPPQPAWFSGREAIAAFLVANPFRYFRWRMLSVAANGRPAAAGYSYDENAGCFLPHSLNVVRVQGGAIAEVTSFLDVTRRGVDDPGHRSFVESGLFARFGLPAALPA